MPCTHAPSSKCQAKASFSFMRQFALGMKKVKHNRKTVSKLPPPSYVNRNPGQASIYQPPAMLGSHRRPRCRHPDNHNPAIDSVRVSSQKANQATDCSQGGCSLLCLRERSTIQGTKRRESITIYGFGRWTSRYGWIL